MNAPLFSVVTVTLNCAEAACRTARSVLEQDFGDFEYLVKDGGSSDGTVAKLRALGVQNIQVAKDTGIYAAMNQALALCRGRYVWFLNADDTFASPRVLATFAEQIRRHGFPRFVYGDMQTDMRHAKWGSSSTGALTVLVRSRLSRFYLYRRTICHQTWAVERALYEQCGGLDEGVRFVADYDFLLKAILCLRASYLRVPCVCIHYAAGGDCERNHRLALLRTQELHRKYFPPLERLVYEGASRAARLIVHGRWFCGLHRRLPPGLQARLAGL